MMKKSNPKSPPNARGRTVGATAAAGQTQRPTKAHQAQVLRTEVNRTVAAGVSHRGDRRDMSRAYTNNIRHPARGNNPRIDVKTRAR